MWDPLERPPRAAETEGAARRLRWFGVAGIGSRGASSTVVVLALVLPLGGVTYQLFRSGYPYLGPILLACVALLIVAGTAVQAFSGAVRNLALAKARGWVYLPGRSVERARGLATEYPEIFGRGAPIGTPEGTQAAQSYVSDQFWGARFGEPLAVPFWSADFFYERGSADVAGYYYREAVLAFELQGEGPVDLAVTPPVMPGKVITNFDSQYLRSADSGGPGQAPAFRIMKDGKEGEAGQRALQALAELWREFSAFSLVIRGKTAVFGFPGVLVDPSDVGAMDRRAAAARDGVQAVISGL